jgi:hypothetical protein
LDEAKELHTVYTGSNDGGRVVYHRREFRLPHDVYDMRASLQFLARATGQVVTGLSLRVSTQSKVAFEAAFCRAVRRLVEDGYLEQWSSPVYHDQPSGVAIWPNRRFVRRTPKPFLPISADMYNAYLRTYTEYRRVRKERLERICRQFSLRM